MANNLKNLYFKSKIKSCSQESNLRGFTILELLVAIAVIALLSSLVLVGIKTARTRSRDARRIADVKTLRNALDTYYINRKQYPPMASCSGSVIAVPLQDKNDSINSVLLADGTMSAPINDPVNGTLEGVTYGIFYNSCGAQSDKTPDPDGSSATAIDGEYYAITFVLETNNFSAQGYNQGNNCVGPKIGSLNKSLGSAFNGSASCNPAP